MGKFSETPKGKQLSRQSGETRLFAAAAGPKHQPTCDQPTATDSPKPIGIPPLGSELPFPLIGFFIRSKAKIRGVKATEQGSLLTPGISAQGPEMSPSDQ